MSAADLMQGVQHRVALKHQVLKRSFLTPKMFRCGNVIIQHNGSANKKNILEVAQRTVHSSVNICPYRVIFQKTSATVSVPSLIIVCFLYSCTAPVSYTHLTLPTNREV